MPFVNVNSEPWADPDLRGEREAAIIVMESMAALAFGSKQDMLALERSLHETLPIRTDADALVY